MKHDPHTLNLALICLVFLIMCGAMFRLYREELSTKRMISEGLMQVKEEMKSYIRNQNQDKVMMQNNKMYMVKNGAVTPLITDITLMDGTKVLKNGTVVSPNNKRTVLANGDAITFDGVFLPH